MNKHLPILVTALILTAATYAEPISYPIGYIGGAFGASNYDGDIIDNKDDVNNDSTAYQIYGGRQFMKYLAIEGRLTNLAEFKYRNNAGDKLDGQFWALTINTLGIYPFGGSGFDIYGQLGFGAIALYSSHDFVPFRATEVLTAGLGARYTPPKLQAMTCGLGYDVYTFGTETFDQTISMAKLNIQYNF